MNQIKQISSLQNTLIKKLLLLKEKKRGRNKSGLFVLEGLREFQMAKKGNYQIETVFFNSNILAENEIQLLIKGLKTKPGLIDVSREVYQRIAYREKTEGILAIAQTKTHSLDQLQLKRKDPLILVAESPEKPGNIGALLRTADAADLDAVIIANPRGDLYNPNVIRSSVGCVFTIPVFLASNSEVISFLKNHAIRIIAASLDASLEYTMADYAEASAIVVGTESTGLSEDWVKHSDMRVVIPMEGDIDSMNVSVSAAILIFEAKRQRAVLRS
ncbi:MAG: RNA methyltransferase [Eudoraea sp.]|nr:RNA methyltransferase [Eudoraea sp.]